uniref:Oxysterol-binding protein n=1 Tax=Musca domestica TaxID=7370 RepID=A0A1I8MC37_MUSDO
MTDVSVVSKVPGNENENDPEMKGWLLKWTNYLKGYQKRWFVLSKGVLSYYRNQGEMTHTCRGTISLHGALIHTVDSCTFVVSNGGTQTFHIKTANEVERQSWVTALELAKVKAIRAMESEEEEEEKTSQVVPSQEITTVLRDLTDRLESLRTCYDLINKHGVALQGALNDLRSINLAASDEETIASRIKIVNERATLFRITSKAMINACNDYLRSAESQGHKWSKALQHERESRQRFEEMVEQLAKQHTQLEQAAHLVQHNKVVPNPPLAAPQIMDSSMTQSNFVSDDETEFFDAEGTSTLTQNESNEDSPQNGSDSGTFILQMPHSNKHMQAEQFSCSSSSSEADLSSIRKLPQQVCVLDNQKSMDTPDRAAPTGGSDRNTKTPSGNNSSPNSSGGHSDSSSSSNPNNQSNSGGGSGGSSGAGGNGEDPNKPGGKSNVPEDGQVCKKVVRQRRTRVPDKPHYPLNLWSIMKNCIGKELSKIPMPVNFNEPLSMLQRLTEDYEYASILDLAARCTDECEQLAYLAAFTVSAYATTANRTGKPFNPLLGETYECDRTDDLGWRCIAEQVSHHPPMAALHCEGRAWTCWQEFTMTSKFRGKYLQIIPLGSAYCHFPKTDHKYTWRKVTTTVNNIIVGKLWVDQHGEMEITGLNAASGLKCMLKYVPYSYFSRDSQRRVKGVVMDRNNEVKWVIRGTWDSKIEIAPALSTSGPPDSPVYQTGNYKTAWQRNMPPPDSEKYYNFTTLAAQLNEMEEGVAPTDSRLRPDQRLMEDGLWEDSNREKLRLEEKQRAKRKQREAEAEASAAKGEPFPPYQPAWFTQEREEGTDNIVHLHTGKYWEHKKRQDWSRCQDIF